MWRWAYLEPGMSHVRLGPVLSLKSGHPYRMALLIIRRPFMQHMVEPGCDRVRVICISAPCALFGQIKS